MSEPSRKAWAYRFCTFPGCSNKHAAKGLCRTHYSQVQRGEVPHPVRTRPKVCSFPDCGRKHNSRGYCSSHARHAAEGRELRPLQIARDVTARDADGNKLCVRCSTWLAESEFGPTKHTRDRLASWCNLCRQAANHGITRTDFLALREQQDDGCAICDGPPTGREFDIDHDHACCPGEKSCGKCIRGLLCGECNRGIGQFRDDINRLARAAVYLSTRSAS